MNAARIDQDAFDILMKLTRKASWLEAKSRQLTELYNLCDTVPQQTLMVDLLERFKHVESAELEHMGDQIADHVQMKWGLSASNTYFVATADMKKGHVDGSQGYLNALKNKFGYEWTADNFIGSIGAGRHAVKSGDTALLFDDFIGSGETIRRQYAWFRDKMTEDGKQVDIKVVAYSIMEFAQIDLVMDGIPVYSPLILKKGISEHHAYSAAEKAVHIQNMLDLEAKLEPYVRGIHLSKYSLGYLKTEAIYAVQGLNVSDNVFPVFWWAEEKPSVTRKTLFRRLN